MNSTVMVLVDRMGVAIRDRYASSCRADGVESREVKRDAVPYFFKFSFPPPLLLFIPIQSKSSLIYANNRWMSDY